MKNLSIFKETKNYLKDRKFPNNYKLNASFYKELEAEVRQIKNAIKNVEHYLAKIKLGRPTKISTIPHN